MTAQPVTREDLHRALLRLLAQQQRTNAEIRRLAEAILKLEGAIADTPGVRRQRSLDFLNRARFEPPYVKEN